MKLKYESIVEKLFDLPLNTLVYAIGNQVGAGQEILTLISNFRKHD